MKKIQVTTQREYTNRNMRREEQRKRRALDRSPLLLLFFICGLLGILFGIGDNTEISTRMYVYTSMFLTAFAVFLWYFYFRYPRIFIIISIVLGAVTVGIFAPEVWSVTSQFMSGNGFEEIRVSAVLIISGLILAVFVLFSLEFILRSHIFVLIISFLILAVTPVFRMNYGYVTVILTAVFNVGFIIVNMTDKRSGKNIFRMNDRNQIAGSAALIALTVLLTAFIPAVPIENVLESYLFDSTNTTRTFVSDTASQIAKNIAENAVPKGITAEGKIHRSAIPQTDNVLMTVTIDKIPEKTVYMHGFQGGSYENGAWKSAFFERLSEDTNKDMSPYNESIIWRIVEELNGDYSSVTRDTSDPVSDIYYNYSMKNKLFNNDVYNVKMTEMNETYSTVCTPYFSQFSEGRIRLNHKIGENGYSNAFTDVENVNMNGYWQDDPAIERFINAYQEKIKTEYTNYPNENMERLKEIVDSNPLENIDDITTFIVCTLQNQADFTNETGVVPFDRDVVDYFLFDSKKGDSVYFASAGTIMYQMYGIPARYVSGFAVKPDDFQKNGDLYTADVTDKQAYSWVEIFFKDYGWVPVDVTPNSEGILSAEYPNYDSKAMREIMTAHNWTFRNIESKDESESIVTAKNHTPTVIIIVLLITAAAAVTAIYCVRKHKKTVLQPQNKDCRVLFDMMMRAIHFEHILTDYNGSEQDFSVKLSESINAVSVEDMEKVIGILSEDNFSPDSDDNENDSENKQFVETVYRKISSYLYDNMKWYRKPIFKYIKNFI